MVQCNDGIICQQHLMCGCHKKLLVCGVVRVLGVCGVMEPLATSHVDETTGCIVIEIQLGCHFAMAILKTKVSKNNSHPCTSPLSPPKTNK